MAVSNVPCRVCGGRVALDVVRDGATVDSRLVEDGKRRRCTNRECETNDREASLDVPLP